MEYILIIVSAVLVNNVVLIQFLGVCPFLGVSKKLSTAVGMGLAVTFVLTISTIFTYLCYFYILLPLGIDFLKVIASVLIIASLVQMVEIILKKASPMLYQALGVFLPLMSTNCVILGLVLIVMQYEYSLIMGVVYATATGLGFALAMVLFTSLREHMEFAEIPKKMQGVPIALVTAGILAMAFMGFAGIV